MSAGAALAPARERLLSLDAFRGLTVAGMILVNNAGDWKHVYPQAGHAAWNGCTLTDLVFPFFVFIVGVAITLSVGKSGAGLRTSLGPIARRTVLLFLLGLLLNAFPFNLPREHHRIPGVLQRIALAYAVAAPLAVATGPRTQVVVALTLLGGWWAALGLHVAGPANLSPEGNVGAWLDRLLLPGRLYERGFDPEGLLSTLPAIATALSGVLAGRWLADAARSPARRVTGLLGAGALLEVAGLACDRALGMPINKQLWTPSYVLFTSGLACQVLGACYRVVDVEGLARWTRPFVPFGRNPILAYVASSLLARGLVYGIKLEGPGGAPIAAKTWLYQATLARGGSTELTSFGYALSYLALWLVVCLVLDAKRIYLKV